MRCEIAEVFGKFPWEVGLLPFHEYRLCRNYVLWKRAMSTPPPSIDATESETWGDQEVAEAEWTTESISSLK